VVLKANVPPSLCPQQHTHLEQALGQGDSEARGIREQLTRQGMDEEN
jgi:hypothetical protein